jgi:hypothetical protein
MVHLPVVAVDVQIETANRRPMTVEAVARKDLGGDHQLFPPKYLLQTTDEIVFLQRNVDFHHTLCARH